MYSVRRGIYCLIFCGWNQSVEINTRRENKDNANKQQKRNEICATFSMKKALLSVRLLSSITVEHNKYGLFFILKDLYYIFIIVLLSKQNSFHLKHSILIQFVCV